MNVWAMWVWMADDVFDFDLYETKEKAVKEALEFIAGFDGTNVRHSGPEELNAGDRDIQCWSFDDARGKDHRVFVEERRVY